MSGVDRHRSGPRRSLTCAVRRGAVWVVICSPGRRSRRSRWGADRRRATGSGCDRRAPPMVGPVSQGVPRERRLENFSTRAGARASGPAPRCARHRGRRCRTAATGVRTSGHRQHRGPLQAPKRINSCHRPPLGRPSFDPLNRKASCYQRAFKASLKNGTHATHSGSSGPASRGPLPFLGVTCWALLGGVDKCTAE